MKLPINIKILNIKDNFDSVILKLDEIAEIADVEIYNMSISEFICEFNESKYSTIKSFINDKNKKLN